MAKEDENLIKSSSLDKSSLDRDSVFDRPNSLEGSTLIEMASSTQSKELINESFSENIKGLEDSNNTPTQPIQISDLVSSPKDTNPFSLPSAAEISGSFFISNFFKILQQLLKVLKLLLLIHRRREKSIKLV